MSATTFPRRARTFRGFRLGQYGQVRDLLRARHLDVSKLTCRASCAGDGSPPLCGKPASWLLTSACTHEHIVPSLACDTHAESARRTQKRGRIVCTDCAHGREPHSCPVTIEFLSTASFL